MGPPGTPAPQPTVENGNLRVQDTLIDSSYSQAASHTVRDIRHELADAAPSALVGGVTATAVDTTDASIDDRNLIIPIILVVILVILMLLLRSILAPVLLIATPVLSFGTAMGVFALVFSVIFEFPGADATVLLVGLVFLVVWGVDDDMFVLALV